ncbi:response regulator [Hyphococcus sp. DH-69]|uniref:response regulator n=1 Tax=Hyphococcus formosus TaxID=3143534 RepID=UPI00398A7936
MILTIILVALSGLGGSLVGWIVTRARKAEETRQQWLADSALLSVSAHQLRTPLNQIVGVLQMMDFQSVDLTPKQQELVEVLHQGTRNLNTALIDILDLLDLQSQELTLDTSPVDLNKLTESLTRRHKKHAAQKDLDLVFDTRKLSHFWYEFDDVRVIQSISSCISQCLTQTDKGGVYIAYDYRPDPRNSEQGDFIISVRDDSAGMDQYAAEAYFCPQKYLINRHMSGAEGHRLGLILARLLTEKMGGSLTAKSAIGSGVTFTLTIPVKKFAAPKPKEVLTDAPLTDQITHILDDKLVLVVDDNDANLMIIKAFLNQIGATRIITASNGVEAVKVAAENECDLILMDIQMPDMDGVTASKIIRNSDKPSANAPIIVLTAAARAEDLENYREAGLSAILAKPIIAEDLYQKVVNVFEDR